MLTGLVRGAIAVGDTLRTTSLVGISMIFGQTLTGAGVAFLSANGIGTAGIGVAGLCGRFLLLHQLTTTEGIAGVTRCTVALRSMAEHVTDGIGATHSGTGIPALLPNAGLVEGALRVGYAFRSALWRCSNVVGQASALRLISHSATLSVGSTR